MYIMARKYYLQVINYNILMDIYCQLILSEIYGQISELIICIKKEVFPFQMGKSQ